VNSLGVVAWGEMNADRKPVRNLPAFSDHAAQIGAINRCKESAKLSVGFGLVSTDRAGHLSRTLARASD
jgi:hypothetical protein